MLCPHCHNEMIIQELEQVEVDHCIACGGIWLDAGELELLLGKNASPDLTLTDATREQRRRCPQCRKTMQKVNFNDNGAIILLDQCPRGHGIWFDAGELHSMIEHGTPGNPVAHLLKEMFGG